MKEKCIGIDYINPRTSHALDAFNAAEILTRGRHIKNPVDTATLKQEMNKIVIGFIKDGPVAHEE